MKHDKKLQIELVANVLSSKWTIPVIGILQRDTMRYSAIEKTIPNISQRSLTIALRNLERYGMIDRYIYPMVPPQVEYRLTPLGLELLKLCEILSDWTKKHETEMKRAQKTYARRNKEARPLL